MTEQKKQVQRFYEQLWNAHDTSVAEVILHADIAFRGSLGLEKRGRREVVAYVDMVHAALDEYRCIIDDWIEEGQKLCAWMTFTGIHRGTFLGFAPTHQRVTWAGCAWFTFAGDKIASLQVLGDIDGLRRQLQGSAQES